MAKLKVETIGAVIDRHPIGSTIELKKDTAERLEAKGYVKIIGEVKKPAKKASAETKSKPKKPASKPATKKKESAKK